MDKSIVESSSMPIMTVEQAVERYHTMLKFIRAIFREGIDYGLIPGTDKPTLLKPGAEKLCSLFGLAPKFEPLNEQADFANNFFYFRYRCDLYNRNNILVATAIGSCNSREKQYRYRLVPEWKADDEVKRSAVRIETRNQRGKQVKFYVVENNELADLVNTIDKKAQVRALKAAVLIAANASELFTQDVEDLVDYIDGQYEEIVEGEGAMPKPKEDKPPVKSGKRASVPEIKKDERPYPPEILKEKLKIMAQKVDVSNEAEVERMRNVVASALDRVFDGDSHARHEMLEYLCGNASTKDIEPHMIIALARWLGIKNFDEPPIEQAIAEARLAHRQALLNMGTMELSVENGGN